MPLSQLPLAEFDTTRWIFGPVVILLGIGLILAGVNNIRTDSATEYRKSRRILNVLRGQSNEYRGRDAMRAGYGRIVAGLIAIAGGIILMIFGAFLK